MTQRGLASQIRDSVDYGGRKEDDGILRGELGEGDRVAFRGSYRATHQGEFMGVPPSGRAVDLQGMSIFRFASDGLIQER